MKDSSLLTDAPQSLTAKINKEKLSQFKGSETTLGYGKVRSWITINKETGNTYVTLTDFIHRTPPPTL